MFLYPDYFNSEFKMLPSSVSSPQSRSLKRNVITIIVSNSAYSTFYKVTHVLSGSGLLYIFIPGRESEASCNWITLWHNQRIQHIEKGVWAHPKDNAYAHVCVHVSFSPTTANYKSFKKWTAAQHNNTLKIYLLTITIPVISYCDVNSADVELVSPFWQWHNYTNTAEVLIKTKAIKHSLLLKCLLKVVQ